MLPRPQRSPPSLRSVFLVLPPHPTWRRTRLVLSYSVMTNLSVKVILSNVLVPLLMCLLVRESLAVLLMPWEMLSTVKAPSKVA